MRRSQVKKLATLTDDSDALSAAAAPLPHPLTPLASTEAVRYACQPNAVFLNVYDVGGGSGLLWTVGLGVHHVGVQVYGHEFQYGHRPAGKGIGEVELRHSPPHTFREQFFLGHTQLSEAAMLALVAELSDQDEWLGNRYHLVKHNCIVFARAFCALLLPPEVRVAQWRQAQEAGVVADMRMEEVEVDGKRYSVPVLMPHHVDRLNRYAATCLPESSIRSVDRLDSPFMSISEGLQARPIPNPPAAEYRSPTSPPLLSPETREL